MRYRYATGRLLPKPQRIFTISIASFALLLTTMCLYVHAQDSGLSEPAPLGSMDDVQGMVIGDSLPAWFWELELNVVNHPEGKTSVKLDNYRGKMRELDRSAEPTSELQSQ